MKYSLMFLYSLLLRDDYKVTNIKKQGNEFELTVTHPTKNNEWVIRLEPDPEDSVRNVLYQMQNPIDSSIQIGQFGPITVAKARHVNK